MCEFLSNLVTGVYGTKKIVLEVFQFDDDESGIITVPKGFVTDGASIPQFGWSIIGVSPFSSSVIYPAVIHDWLYATHQTTRREADKVFLRAMRSQGYLKDWQINIMYRCVRLFGGRSYKKDNLLDKIVYPEKLKYYIKK